ncbi:proline--tRNA ligase [Sphingomonas sp. SUN039]|uniref:proline--tRNA ligase n=1 Tax=Sphingomonas sp. SUN039 TaxID=2937787 RepID=UPI0021643651|nr:proline--tRNA ligase [Sphingomonas sp. SUN039]UVO53364.1 proline--tRNA ligase [Sphingomonas sp. SUN039]
MKHALSVTRATDFAAWYQDVIKEADLAEESGVRGCMVIRPWGYGMWERIQKLMDAEIKKAGVENCYFPLFIPLSYFEKEADHVEGFAKEMAVVTHHRLIADGAGKLIPDPGSKLEEPLVVRPTSETVIGAAMARWVQSWRDLPLMINQWANVVRWEMRTRMFLRTSEFLWQEGHTAHADKGDAMAETLRALEMYRAFAEGPLAMPVIAGEKPEHERFPGADATYSIEAMMQDGKALQAGTSHYLGTTFAEAAGIRYQDKDGGQALCHTTSWGVSTRLIGGVIMTHGDDDGLRCPPQIAPWQVVIVPMLRDGPEDEAVLDYCRALHRDLSAQAAFGEPVRVLLDTKANKASNKRWAWVKKGAPLIVEVGPRDVGEGKAAVLRRDRLYGEGGKLATAFTPRDAFVAEAAATLADIERSLHSEATARRDAAIVPVTSWAEIEAYFAGNEDAVKGWVSCGWSRPTGAALEDVVKRLKALKLTARNTPLGGAAPTGACVFTGEATVEMILIGRTY